MQDKRWFCFPVEKTVNEDGTGGHVGLLGYINAYKLLVGKPKLKIPLDRPIQRWEDNIKMERREIWLGLNWFGSGQRLIADSREHDIQPSSSIKFRKFWLAECKGFVYRISFGQVWKTELSSTSDVRNACSYTAVVVFFLIWKQK